MNINNSLTRKEMDNRVPRESLKEQNLALCPRRNSSPGNIMSLRANQSNQSVKKIESRYKQRDLVVKYRIEKTGNWNKVPGEMQWAQRAVQLMTY